MRQAGGGPDVPARTGHGTDGGEATAGIAEWIAFYNTERPHQALGYATPMAVWCDGVIDAIAARAVDMVDNASALPTCPQPKNSSRQ